MQCALCNVHCALHAYHRLSRGTQAVVVEGSGRGSSCVGPVAGFRITHLGVEKSFE